jgi:REP element-mobilizing transposase RayT
MPLTTMDLTACENIAGATYHVMNRGNRKVPIYEDERDRKRFNRLLIQAKTKYHVDVLCGTQQVTHFHAIVTTPHANLSEFMQHWEGEYAKYSNWRHGRVGHLFQGPFRRVMIQNDLQLFTAAWYVFTNPVAGGMVRRPEQWKWSTYAATAGLAPLPEYLSIDWLETLLPAESLKASQELLRRCMAAPYPIGAYLDAVNPTCQAALRSYTFERLQSIPQPCSYRTLMRPSLDELFQQHQRPEARAEAIRVAHETHGYKLAEIARCLGVHRATASQIYCRKRRTAPATPETGTRY